MSSVETENRFNGRPLSERSSLRNDNVITGTLLFDRNDTVAVESVDIILKDIDKLIANVKTEYTRTGASFVYTISTAARAGEYSVIWNTTISGRESKVYDGFVIAGDEIDRSLPLELQYLK